ncbi:zinc finger protein 839 [Solea senegalensis]|uniref:Zinc finger protein 839 n=1 Tax=Solea senegalensis TaxID=28829 RepID=A0AAV6RYF7_SOLSE|nr:uncharacterized protein znf839 [Solea senegalensis]KAG7509683.1 zinc finger protein 839 [Solea senegalensis]
MADNEDDSGSIRKKSPPHAVFCSQSAGTQGTQPRERVSASPSGSGAQLEHVLQRCPDEQSVIVGTELALGSDLVNTTIIYVQPDGSLVDGSGLTSEQQQALLEQLTKQELVQVSDLEAAQLLQQSQAKTVPVHSAVLEPSQLQQVINQVTKSKQPQVHIQASKQKQSQVPQQNLIQVPQLSMKNQNNASQQLKSVAQQVAMQTSGMVQVVQKKLEPVRIQIQVPPKQEVKPGAALQQNNVLVHQPQVKLSTNGSVSSAQIIHLQPVVGQQGQQFFFQQSPGDPHIQLLLQSPAPVVGSLLPVVHKVTGQTTKMATASGPSPKPAVSLSAVKTPPPPTTVSIPIIKSPANDPTAAGKSPLKSPNINTPAPRQMTTPPPAAPAVKDKERDDKKKVKTRQKKVLKVQTRSGRVSRPPKYKAKDYMFIKTEDLADSHQSDSDDYSDMSVEEEGEGGRKDGHVPGTSPSLTYSHKSRSHRCQTCDKAYIGPGGLNRHYKLNPSHGDPETPDNQPSNALGDISQSQETIATEGRDKTAAAMATNRVDIGPASAFGLKSCHHRGPGRPRGRGRGRGRLLAPSPKLPHMTVGLVSRRGRRGRPPKLSVTSEQQTQKRRDRLHELVEQCEDEELMDIVLPRLTQVLSLWELLLAKVERGGSARTRFPDVYREYESLQVHVKEAAQDYIINPQAGATPLEVTNIEVARSLGILDEVNRMKVVPGAAPPSSLTNKNVRYMENSKMLPPSKRFKMENSIQVQQNGIEKYTTGGTTETSATSATSVTSSLKTCSVSVSPLMIPDGSKLTLATDSASSSCGSTLVEALPPETTGVSSGEDQGEGPLLADQVQSQHQVLKTPDIKAQMKELEEVQGRGPGSGCVHTPGSTHTPESSESGRVQNLQDSESRSTDASESKELQEGQEIYIQTEGLTVQLAEPGSDRIVIVNGPDGTTMHIQTPEGIPLEAVQALLGIESSDGTRASQ